MNTNSVYPDQMPHSAASDLGLHCLPMSLLWDTRLKWVNNYWYKNLLFSWVIYYEFQKEAINVHNCWNKYSLLSVVVLFFLVFILTPSKTMFAHVLKFHIWIPHETIGDPYFFLIRIISHFGVISLLSGGHIASGLSVHSFVTLSYAKHNFRTMYANVLKFHIWIAHEKIGDLYFFFLSELSPILELFSF